MNTLTGIEAERAGQILDHAINRLKVLTHIPPKWDDDFLAEIPNEAVKASLERLWSVEERLSDVGSITDLSDRPGEDIDLLKQLHRASRSTCRNILADKESYSALISRPEIQSEDFSLFIKYLTELKEHFNTRLTTTVEDEAANRSNLHELTERERNFEEMEDALKRKLNEVRENKDQVVFALDQTLRKFQLELQDITQHNAIELGSVQREMQDAITKATTDHELRMRQLQDQADAMERQTQEIMNKNKDDEQRLRKEKNRYESTLNAKIAQYDESMYTNKAALEELRSNYQQEEAAYLALKEYFDKVDADIVRSVEEENIIRAVQAREDFGLSVMDVAASNIQRIVRGRQTRVVFAKLLAKSKKGKGKKGGKKGKK